LNTGMIVLAIKLKIIFVLTGPYHEDLEIALCTFG